MPCSVLRGSFCRLIPALPPAQKNSSLLVFSPRHDAFINEGGKQLYSLRILFNLFLFTRRFLS